MASSILEQVAKLTTINAEIAEFAEIHQLCGLSEFCVQRRVGNFQNALLASLDRALLPRRLDFFITQAQNPTKNFFRVLSEERRATNVRR